MSSASTDAPRWPPGPRLRRLMRDRGRTPLALARAAAVPPSTLYPLLDGARRPMEGTVDRLLAALGCTRADLDAAAPLAARDDPARYTHRARENRPSRENSLPESGPIR